MIDSRITSHYNKTISKELVHKFDYLNFHELINLEKIVLNLSLKSSVLNKTDKELIDSLLALYLIRGSVPELTFAKKSNLKLHYKKKDYSGITLILKKKAATNFVDFFIHFVAPRIKNLKPIHKIDNKGNLTLYLSSLLSFTQLELNYQHFHILKDLTITFVFNSKKQSKFLSSSYRIPIR